MRQRVLVTGAGGFIGSHLVERLLERGYAVRAMVHYNSAGHRHNLEQLPPATLAGVEVLHGDVTDPLRVDEAVRGCEIVFHLAALIGIPYSYSAPHSYLMTNVFGTANVMNSCLRAGARLVHTSTSEVYGSARYVPIDEGHPLAAQSPYAATKIAADKLVESYCNSFGLSACVVRPFNTYGPRQSGRAVIPTIISQALSGDAVRLGSTTPVRDLTYVTDTADGFIAAAQSSLTSGDVVNLGCGVGISIREIVDEVGRRLGRRLTIVTDPERVRPPASEVVRLISDNRRAATAIDWRPSIPLSEGLDATIEYLERHLTDYNVAAYTV